MFRGTNLFDFMNRFKSNNDCLEYIFDIKWSNGNFQCRKCGNTNFSKGKKPFSKRCTRCKYDESPTANIAFSRLEFDMLIAFHILCRLSVKKKGMSSYELSKEFNLSQKSCWKFRVKVQKAMASSKRFPLKGNVDVDEFVVGGPEEGERGRSHGKKKLAIVALERAGEFDFGRAYAKDINSYSTKEFRPFFEDHISKDAKIRTDEWVAYNPLKDDFPLLEQEKSGKGENFRELHIHIMNFKGWLRGIHHHCSQEHMQGYLDEYHFRFNRRNNMDTIFHKLVERMVIHENQQTT